MVQGEVRYTKVSTDVHDEPEPEPDPNEDSDEEGQVTVSFKVPADNPQGKSSKRLTCFRVSAALVLLGTVLVFALLQWYEWWPDTEGFPNVGTNIMNISNEHDEHHHHTMDEDDEQEDAEDPHHHEHTALYHHAVVLTASANCSSIGMALLQEGGNVVDAAISSLLCLGVVHPHTAGVGGMFSAVLYNNTSGSLKTIRSTAPQMLFPTFGVPSILQGIQELHSRWGRSEWSRLFEEAIKLAQEGFLIDDVLGRALESYKEEILVSELCDLFCDASGRVKSVGAIVKNQNLSELLQRASLNENNFLETLAVKLSEDLSVSERPAFLAAIQHSRGEINDFLIIQQEKYSVLSAGLPFSVQMLSDILQQVRQQNLSFQNSADFNRTSAAYSVLLSLIREPDESAMAEKYPGFIDALSLNTQNSHIAVLDKSGNFIVMSASLNSTWGSGRFLPSTGILLNGFSTNVSNLPYFNIPLVLRLTEDHVSHSNETEDNEEENEIEVVVMTGGLSALFNAAVLLHNRIDLGLSSEEAISSPLLHLQPPAFCLSSTLNDSDIYTLFSDVGGVLQQVDECSDNSPSMLLRLHAEHVSAYGAPAANAHINGY